MSNPEQDVQAARHIRALKAIQAEMQHNEDVYEGMVEEAERWLENENHSLEKQAEFHRNELQLIAIGYDFGNKKSRNVPGGTFGWRQKPVSLNVVDEEKAKEWARKEGILKVEQVEKYSKRDLLECVKTRGEVPDGCEIEEERDEFYYNLEE